MLRTVIIGGREIRIRALGEPMDFAFDRLHAAYFASSPFTWEEFATNAFQYFDQNIGSLAAAENYFQAFTVLWQFMLSSGRIAEAEQVWQTALESSLQWECAHSGQHIHKGTPYYFWGMTALLQGHIDRGYLLIHQAVDEDSRTDVAQMPNLPAFALVSLNYAKVDQAFRQWVINQADFLNRLVEEAAR